jgi:hypothetical protein
MKTRSSIDVNLGCQTRARRYCRASAKSATTLCLWLGTIVIALTCGTAIAQQAGHPVSPFQRSLNVSACGYGLGYCNEALLTASEAVEVTAIRHRQNVTACGYGLGYCNEALLTHSETVQVAAIRHKQNISACEYGFGPCSPELLTSPEAAAVRSFKARQQVLAGRSVVPAAGENPMTFPTAIIVPRPVVVAPPSSVFMSTLIKALTNSTVAPVAENGSYYGEPNKNGVPKTVSVQGYTRSDGTYVRGYYRSAPGTNP